MTMIPEVAINMLVPIVDRLSQEIILNSSVGDWETTMHFEKMLTGTTIRFTLAEIAVAVKQDEPDWPTIGRKVEKLAEAEKLIVPSTLKVYISLQQNVVDLMNIDSGDEEKLSSFLRAAKKRYGEAKLYAMVDTLVNAYKEGKEGDILRDKPFARTFIMSKFHKWFKNCISELGPTPDPKALNGKRKRHAQQSKAQIKGLRNARARLRETVVDPLEEARAIGKQAKHQGGELYTKKKSAKRLSFGNDDDEEDEELDEPEEEAQGTHQLSEVPEKMKYRSPKKTSRKSSGSMKSPGAGRKKRWTHEQRNALKAAIKDYGLANWAGIKAAEEYGKFWEGRSNVQIKDLYRTMKGQGTTFEVPGVLE